MSPLTRRTARSMNCYDTCTVDRSRALSAAYPKRFFFRGYFCYDGG
jgi:hypothetical protein